MPIAQLITLILAEAPAAVDLINKLRDQGRTVPTEQEVAELGLSDTALAGAYERLFGAPPRP